MGNCVYDGWTSLTSGELTDRMEALSIIIVKSEEVNEFDDESGLKSVDSKM